MKYEIIKGSEKDFEQAPEWAMQVESLIDSNTLFYTEAINGSQTAKHLCQWSDESISRPLAHSANSIGGGFTVIAQRRPITEPVVNQQLPTEWNGTGIAYLGQHVEYFWEEGKEWRKAEVVAHYEEWPLLKDIEDGLMVAELNNKMRPIRSAEDVARDEFVKALVYFDNNRKTFGIDKLYGEIYDAIAAGKIPGIKLEN
ncbi:MAG: hypothetical protein [Caudoviricetes sp.]|nr:MAG: hypothetical protein [Caudoviricetes sp.]